MSKIKVKLKCFRGANKPDDIVEYDADLANAMVARGSAVLVGGVVQASTPAENIPAKTVAPSNSAKPKNAPKSTTVKVEDDEL